MCFSKQSICTIVILTRGVQITFYLPNTAMSSLLFRHSTRSLIKRSFFRPTTFNLAHFTTTVDTVKPTSIDKKTSSKIELLLDLIPGGTKIRKSICFTTTAAVMTYLIKSGIYIVNHETLVLVAFYLAMRLLYIKVGPPLGEYLQASIDVITMTTII